MSDLPVNPAQAPKANKAWWAMAVSYVGTLVLLAAALISSPPPTDDPSAQVFVTLMVWGLISLPLLIFIPWILKKSPYAASWLSYLSLLYFVLVMALSSGIWIWLLSLSSLGIFLGSMMFTRWQKAGV